MATNTNTAEFITTEGRVAPMTIEQIVGLDVAAFRAAHAAATIRHFEFRVLPADDEALRYSLFRHVCNNVRSDEQAHAAYLTPRLILSGMADGMTFGDALAAVVIPHRCTTVRTTEGGFDRITGTGRQTVTTTCTTCGHSTTRTTVRNWTGD